MNETDDLPDLNASPSQSGAGRQSDINTVAAGMSVSLFGKITGRAIYALTQVLLARFLGPALYGLYALGWTALQLIGALAPLGLNKGMIRFGAVYWPDDMRGFKGILTRALVISTLTGLTAGVALFLGASALEQAFNQPGLAEVLRFVAVALPLASAMSVLVAATQVSRRMKYSIYAEEYGWTLSNLGLILLFQFLGYGLLGATVAMVLSFVIGFLLAGAYTLKLYPNLRRIPSKQAVSNREMMTFSLPTMFADALLMMAVWINPLLIGYFLPADQVGIYQAMSQVPIIFSITLRAVNAIFAPFIASLYHERQMSRLETLYRITTKWAIYISLPVFLIICFAAHPLVNLLFGADYAGDTQVLVILAISQMINVATGSVGFLLIMTNHQKDWFVLSTVGFAMNLVLNILVIPRVGITGTAVVSLLTISLLNIGGLLRINWVLHIWPYDRRILKGLLAALAAAAVLAMTRLLPIESNLISLLLTTVLSFGVFLLSLYLQGLDDEDRDFLSMIRARLKGRPAAA